MKKLLYSGLAAAVFAFGAPAQDWKAAIEKLPTYDFGQSRTFLVPLDEAVRAAAANKEEKALEQALAKVLEGKTTIEARRYALRAIGPLASAESVPVIAKYANDPAVGDIALWALERITDPAAGKVLTDALAAAPEDHKLPLILGLGWRREASATGALAALLGNANEDIAVASAEALARIRNTDACEKIIAAHASASGRLRAALAGAALNCADQLLADDKTKKQAIDLYTKLSTDKDTSNVRAAALGGLVKAEPDEALKYVVAAFTGEDAALARVAARYVRELPGTKATEAFVALLAEATPENKATLLDALADRGDTIAHDAVAAAASSDDDIIKLPAVRALGRLGKASDAALLVELSTNASGDLKRAAQTSLATLPGDDTNKALVGLATQGNLKLRSTAIATLMERRAQDVRADLMKLMDDADAGIRSDAYTAVETLAEASDLPALLARVPKGGDEATVAALERVIAAVSNRIPVEGQRAAALVDAINKASTPAEKTSLIRVLGAVPTTDSLETLKPLTTAIDPDVRLAAINALADWPDIIAADSLLPVLDTPKTEEDRSVAMAGIIRLVRDAKLPCSKCLLGAYQKFVELARTYDERKQIIAALSSLSSVQALELLETFKTDPELATDASSGIIGVARLISGAYPALAKEKLMPFTKEGTPDALKKPAEMALAHLSAFEDYITAWEVSGPYLAENKSGLELFDIPFAPENAPDDAKWNIAPMAFNNPEFKPWAVDLEAIIGGQERMAYLRTKLKVSKAQTDTLELGTNDGCKVWLDGELIHSFKEGRPLLPGEDKVKLTLSEGDHTLLIAVYQQGWHWGACARITTTEGLPVEGVTTSVE